MANGRVTLSKQIAAVDEKANQILAILIGDPKNPEKAGLVQRVKTLEDEQTKQKEGRTWLARTAASPAISAIVTGAIIFALEAILYYWRIQPLLDKMLLDESLKR